MRETWLITNRRAIAFGCVPPAAVVASGAWLTIRAQELGLTWRWIGVAAIVFGLAIMGMMLHQLLRPRIAFENGQVLFYMRKGPPIAVPVHIVEAFFAGQGPAQLPGLARQPQSLNLIARLSQRHTEWASRNVKITLGSWSDGYVTIRGSWCEPLDGELIRKLNRRLKEVKDAT